MQSAVADVHARSAADKSTSVCNQRFTSGLHEDTKLVKTTIFKAHKISSFKYHKMLDFCGSWVYYMPRYSGIVQSVEQRTVKIDRVLKNMF